MRKVHKVREVQKVRKVDVAWHECSSADTNIHVPRHQHCCSPTPTSVLRLAFPDTNVTLTKALLWCLVGQTIKISPSLCWCTHLRWPVFVRVSFVIVRYHDRLRDWNLGRRTRFAALLRPYLSVPQLWSFCAGWSCANSRTFWKSSDDPTCIESVCVCLSARGESLKLGRRAFGLI